MSGAAREPSRSALRGSGSTSIRPKVGQGGSPAESKIQTGKFERTPPSTIRCSRPSRVECQRQGSKKIGIPMLILTASATGR